MKKIAYLVLAHSDPKHFEKLVNAIDYNAKIFVHLDAKSNLEEFQKLSLPAGLVFIKNRVRVSWAGISMVDATLRLIEESLNSGENFARLVLLSGADYPIKKISVIHDMLTQNPEHEFIKYIDMRQSSHYTKHVNQKWFKEPLFHTSGKTLKFLDKLVRYLLDKIKLPNSWDKEIIPYFGSQWWALTPGCAEYILKFVKNHPAYYEINKYTFSPDEHFFHTLVGNSLYQKKCDGLQEFKARGTWRMANIHIIHSSLNKWYTINDLDEIKSSDKLFVRKVNSTVSDTLINFIDEKILK